MRGRSLGNGRGDAPRVNAKRIFIGILVAVLVVVGVSQLGDDDEATPVPSTASSPTTVTDAHPQPAAPPAAPTWATKLADASSGSPIARDPDPPPTPSAAADTIAAMHTSTPHVAVERRPSARVAPDGTGSITAKSFSRIPVSRHDRAPVGEIAITGLHVDRISVGNEYEDSRCKGASDMFTVGRDAEVHVCLRVVHLRQKERLVVRWEKDGRVVRRTRLAIPPYHAYRTRAGLRLRSGYEGRWRVRVMTPGDKRELAAATFTVDA